MSKSFKVTLFSFVLILTFLSLVTFTVTKQNAEAKKSDSFKQLTLFGDVFQRVKDAYVEEVTDKDLIKNAINGMLSNLDPHSSFLDNEDFEDMQVSTKGSFGGLGIEVTMEDGFVKVVSPIDDTPAAKADIKSGDLIIGVDKESVYGLTLDEAVEKLRGPIGASVLITIQRGDLDPFEIEIIRDEIKISSVRTEIFDKIGYVRITTFSQQATPGLIKGIKEFKETLGDSLQGIVLDLRNNPGGLLDQAVSVTDAFLEKGEIVSTRGRDGDNSTHHYSRPGDIIDGLPIVILINEGSASASEIVAGALKDHERAIILGKRSFGKGSVQTVIPLPGHGAMRLTTARYYTPSGISIQAKGISPNIEVETARIETINYGTYREEDLKGALDNNKEDDSKSSENQNNDNKEPEKSQDEIDYQLSRALDLIKGAFVFKKFYKE